MRHDYKYRFFGIHLDLARLLVCGFPQQFSLRQ